MRISVNIFKNKLIQIIIFIVGLGLIANLSNNIFRMFRVTDELRSTEQKVRELGEQKENLTGKMEFYQSEEFIEQEARNKLNMVKEGEVVIVLPSNLKEILKEKEIRMQVSSPNWRQWLELFL